MSYKTLPIKANEICSKNNGLCTVGIALRLLASGAWDKMKLMVVSSQGIEMDQTGRGKAWCEYPDRPGCCPAMCTS